MWHFCFLHVKKDANFPEYIIMAGVKIFYELYSIYSYWLKIILLKWSNKLINVSVLVCSMMGKVTIAQNLLARLCPLHWWGKMVSSTGQSVVRLISWDFWSKYYWDLTFYIELLKIVNFLLFVFMCMVEFLERCDLYQLAAVPHTRFEWYILYIHSSLVFYYISAHPSLIVLMMSPNK